VKSVTAGGFQQGRDQLVAGGYGGVGAAQRQALSALSVRGVTVSELEAVFRANAQGLPAEQE